MKSQVVLQFLFKLFLDKMNLFYLLFLFFISVTAYSQNKNQTDKGNISGFVFDRETNLHIEGASVQLFSLKDSSITEGTETDSKGSFSFKDVLYGRYSLKVSMISYSSAVIKVIVLNSENRNLNLDTIKLKSGIATTDEIEITAEKSMIEFQGEKKVFNVTNDIVDKGGTATDLLRKIPSVSVDEEGNISLRGSPNIQLQVDGKPLRQNSAAILQQLPASSVQSIELLTNPSAKYEAEGEGGILNIVLKKGAVSYTGYEGIFSLSAGNNDKYNGAVNLSMKNKKINLYTNYSYRNFNMDAEGSSELEKTSVSNPQYINQTGSTNNKTITHLIKSGADFFIDQKNTLGLSATYNYRSRDRDELANVQYLNSSEILYSRYLVNTFESGNNNTWDVSLNYSRLFSSPSHKLTGDASYSYNNEEGNLNSSRQQYTVDFIPVNNTPRLLRSFGDNKNYLGIIQLDYTQPLESGTGKISMKNPALKKKMGSSNKTIEFGVKGIFRKLDNDYLSEVFDYQQNTYVNNVNRTNHFIYNINIYAGYIIYSNLLGKLNYQLGLRSEYSPTNFELPNTTEKYEKNNFDLFPSVNLTYEISPFDNLQAGYTRRINRPNPNNLNPFIDYSDPLNLRKGNPDLEPEYTNSFQLTYLKFFGGVSLNPSVFYKNTYNSITRFRTIIDTNATLTTFLNLADSKTYGAELIAALQAGKNISLNGSVNYSNTQINGTDVQPTLNNSGETWTVKFNGNFNLWYDIDLQMSYNYQGLRPMILGEIQPFWSFDIGVKKDILDNKFSISARASDIFNTTKFNIYLENTGYIQNNYRKMESRSVFLTLTYNIGKIDSKQQTKKGDRDDNKGTDIDF